MSDFTIEERRRYALLQAAVAIKAASFMSYQSHEISIQPHYYETDESAVAMAMLLLAEVERREHDGITEGV